MRRLLVVLALIVAPLTLGAAAPARDWSTVVSRTSAGAYAIGNPRAKVMLVEYLSYTCPHCAQYSIASTPILKRQMVKSGSTRVEFRHATRDKLDLAATLLARCAGPKGFPGLSEAMFARQDDWLARGQRFEMANGARIASYPQLAQLRAYADGAGLTAIARARGLGDAAIDACFAKPADLGVVLAMTDAAWAKISGTPSFEVNGKTVGHADWAKLEPILRAAGAK